MYIIRYLLPWEIALFFWILMETLATTILNHRVLTHGSGTFVYERAVRFWLFWSRSGMVKYREWVQNHAWHHAKTDTDEDTHTPWARNRLTGQRPLPRLWPWNFWVNGQSYYRTSLYLAEHPEELQRLATTDKNIRGALERLDAIRHLETKYHNVGRAMKINLTVFALVAIPGAVSIASKFESVALQVFVFVAAEALLAWLAIGLKVVAYLAGGFIVNKYGHMEKKEPHQSNVAWYFMTISFFMLGEGWHRKHHDVPDAFNLGNTPWLDLGYAVSLLMAKFGVMEDICIRKKIGKRRYGERIVLYPSIARSIRLR